MFNNYGESNFKSHSNKIKKAVVPLILMNKKPLELLKMFKIKNMQKLPVLK